MWPTRYAGSEREPPERGDLGHTIHAPSAPRGDPHAPPNTLGIRRIAFAVYDIDTVAGLRARDGELVGEVVRYEDSYQLWPQ
jgi:hypothetical protein